MSKRDYNYLHDLEMLVACMLEDGANPEDLKSVVDGEVTELERHREEMRAQKGGVI